MPSLMKILFSKLQCNRVSKPASLWSPMHIWAGLLTKKHHRLMSLQPFSLPVANVGSGASSFSKYFTALGHSHKLVWKSRPSSKSNKKARKFNRSHKISPKMSSFLAESCWNRQHSLFSYNRAYVALVSLHCAPLNRMGICSPYIHLFHGLSD